MNIRNCVGYITKLNLLDIPLVLYQPRCGERARLLLSRGSHAPPLPNNYSCLAGRSPGKCPEIIRSPNRARQGSRRAQSPEARTLGRQPTRKVRPCRMPPGRGGVASDSGPDSPAFLSRLSARRNPRTRRRTLAKRSSQRNPVSLWAPTRIRQILRRRWTGWRTGSGAHIETGSNSLEQS